MRAVSLVEKGWAGARCLSVELSERGTRVRHLVRGTIPKEILSVITPHPGIQIQGIPVRLYRPAVWAALLLEQLLGRLRLVIVDNPKTAEWVARTFPGFKKKILLVGETATGQLQILSKGAAIAL